MPRRVSREDIHLTGSIATIIGTAILVVGAFADLSAQTRSLVLHLGVPLIGAMLLAWGLIGVVRPSVAAIKTRRSSPAAVPVMVVEAKALPPSPYPPLLTRVLESSARPRRSSIGEELVERFLRQHGHIKVRDLPRYTR